MNFIPLYSSCIALHPGNNMPVANSHRQAAMTGFSHVVPFEGITVQLPGVTRAHCVLAHNRLITRTTNCNYCNLGRIRNTLYPRIYFINEISNFGLIRNNYAWSISMSEFEPISSQSFNLYSIVCCIFKFAIHWLFVLSRQLESCTREGTVDFFQSNPFLYSDLDWDF